MTNEEIEARRLELSTQINELAAKVFGQGRFDLMAELLSLNHDLFSLNIASPILG